MAQKNKEKMLLGRNMELFLLWRQKHIGKHFGKTKRQLDNESEHNLALQGQKQTKKYKEIH